MPSASEVDQRYSIRRDLINLAFSLFGAPATYASYVKCSIKLPFTWPRLLLMIHVVLHITFTWIYAIYVLRRAASSSYQAIRREKPWILLNLILLTISGPLIPLGLFLAPLGGDSPTSYQRPTFFFTRSLFFLTTTLCTGLDLADGTPTLMLQAITNNLLAVASGYRIKAAHASHGVELDFLSRLPLPVLFLVAGVLTLFLVVYIVVISIFMEDIRDSLSASAQVQAQRENSSAFYNTSQFQESLSECRSLSSWQVALRLRIKQVPLLSALVGHVLSLRAMIQKPFLQMVLGSSLRMLLWPLAVLVGSLQLYRITWNMTAAPIEVLITWVLGFGVGMIESKELQAVSTRAFFALSELAQDLVPTHILHAMLANEEERSMSMRTHSNAALSEAHQEHAAVALRSPLSRQSMSLSGGQAQDTFALNTSSKPRSEALERESTSYMDLFGAKSRGHGSSSLRIRSTTHSYGRGSVDNHTLYGSLDGRNCSPVAPTSPIASRMSDRSGSLVKLTKNLFNSSDLPKISLDFPSLDFPKTLPAPLKVASQSSSNLAAMIRSTEPQFPPKASTSGVGSAVAYEHEAVTVLFADICNFTDLSSQVSASVMFDFLNELYARYDSVVEQFGVYKVETIGDCYMCATGLIHSDPRHAFHMVQFALEMQRQASEVYLPDGSGLTVKTRIGIHSGPVLSGVIGRIRRRYCLVGSTVNIASRMESTGQAGRIHVSSATQHLVASDADGSDYLEWDDRGEVQVKGIGAMKTFFLHQAGWDDRPSLNPPPDYLQYPSLRHGMGMGTSADDLLASPKGMSRLDLEGWPDDIINSSDIVRLIDDELEEDY